MKKSHIILTLFTAVLFAGATAFSTKENKANESLKWHTDAKAAGELSKETGKPVFAFFTGSDWCGWCMKLQRDVFAKQEFITWANDKVILLELDFPRRKKLSAELTKQNNELRNVFRVNGYPTIWMFTMKGEDPKTKNLTINALGSLGYPSGAVKGKEEVKFLKSANAILKKSGI